jgi:hypothetical protein
MRTFALSVGLFVLVLLAAAPIRAEQGIFESFGAHTLPSTKTPVGPTVAGFALSLTADAPAAALGSPIWVTVELRPISNQGARVEYGSRHSAYAFRIMRQSDGTVAPAVTNSFGLAAISGPNCGHVVPGGDSVFGRFQLDELYALTKPGTYSITVSGMPIIECKPVTIESNTIAITIRP